MGHSCEPPPGKTYLTIGQDFFSIQEYLSAQYNASLEAGSTRTMQEFVPAATMFYTDIQELKGLKTPVDYGSGMEYAGALAEAFPDSGIQIGLWLNGTQGCRDIVAGKLDSQLHQLFATLLERLDVLPQIFLRVGYEFDNPWFGYSDDPKVYRNAFRTLVQFCEEHYDKCHEKISFCWHSWAAPKRASLLDFYPGDRYVDWIGISIFQQLYPWANNNNMNTTNHNEFAGGTREQVEEVLQFAQKHEKPIMIAESTPFGGMSGQYSDSSSSSASNDSISWTEDDIWDLWFQPTLDLIETYDIGMWSYINCDWDSQPMWHGVGFGDTRLSSSKDVFRQWQEQVSNNSNSSRFLTSLECPKPTTSTHGHHHHHATSTKSIRTEIVTVDSLLRLLVIIGVVLVLGWVLWLVQRLCCRLRVDNAATTLFRDTSYQPVPEAREDMQGSSWSINL